MGQAENRDMVGLWRGDHVHDPRKLALPADKGLAPGRTDAELDVRKEVLHSYASASSE